MGNTGVKIFSKLAFSSFLLGLQGNPYKQLSWVLCCSQLLPWLPDSQCLFLQGVANHLQIMMTNDQFCSGEQGTGQIASWLAREITGPGARPALTPASSAGPRSQAPFSCLTEATSGQTAPCRFPAPRTRIWEIEDRRKRNISQKWRIENDRGQWAGDSQASTEQRERCDNEVKIATANSP